MSIRHEKSKGWRSNIHCEKSAMSWSLLTLSGRFCKNRILFGGKYSSGIWTAGRLGAETAGPSAELPSVKREITREKSSMELTLSGQTLGAELLFKGVGVAGGLWNKRKSSSQYGMGHTRTWHGTHTFVLHPPLPMLLIVFRVKPLHYRV